MFRKTNTAGFVAKERLKILLVHDRANMTPNLLVKMKNEIFTVLSRHIEINAEESDIRVTRTYSDEHKDYVPALVANIVIKAKSIEKSG